jgi:hypothetical protein
MFPQLQVSSLDVYASWEKQLSAGAITCNTGKHRRRRPDRY